MSTTRTQVYFSEEQRRRIDDIVRAKGITLATVVREAVDFYLARAPVDAAEALRSTFGAAPELETPSRDDWAEREERLKVHEPVERDSAEESDVEPAA